MTSRSTERTPAEVRRWREAHAAVKRGTAVSWPQAVRDARALDEKRLQAAAQGCTSRTCVQHGAINHVRHERGILHGSGVLA